MPQQLILASSFAMIVFFFCTQMIVAFLLLMTKPLMISAYHLVAPSFSKMKVPYDGNIQLVMTQTGLIDQILDDVGLAGKAAYGKNTPAVGILYPSPNAQPFNAP